MIKTSFNIMENFTAHNPVCLHFGKDVMNDLGKTIEKLGKRVLLVYGKGSIKKNGIYQKTLEQLNSIGAEVFEYSGIKPNPIIEDVDAAAELGRQNNIDVILSVGGGSVIDSSKIISITIPVKTTGWDFYSDKLKPVVAIPHIAVLTLAATGTEMNPFAVLQNMQTKQKLGTGFDQMFPVHSFLDPQNTFSVPKDQTSYGIVDLIAHALEAYFGAGDATLSDRFITSIIKEAITYGPLLLNDLHNYNLRAKIMYAATAALNKSTTYGKVSGDWGVHSIGHILSLEYDMAHGATLSIAYPAWLRLQKTRIPERITELGKELFNSGNADETIDSFETFFKSIESPTSLTEASIGKEQHQTIYDLMVLNNVSGMNCKLNPDDYWRLIEFMG